MKMSHGVTLTIIMLAISGFMLSRMEMESETYSPQLNSNNENQKLEKFSSLDKMEVIKSENKTLTEEVKSLRQEMILLRRVVASVQAQLRERTISVADKTLKPKGIKIQKPSQDEINQANLERSEVLEAAFSQETIDQKWASQTKYAIESVFNKKNLGATVVQNLECRSNSCRLELSSNSNGDLAKKLPLLIEKLGNEELYVTANELTDDTGQNNLVLYMSKEAEVR